MRSQRANQRAGDSESGERDGQGLHNYASQPMTTTLGHAAWQPLFASLLLWPGRGGNELMAEADQRGLGLDRPGSEQNLLAPLRIGPLLAQLPGLGGAVVDGGGVGLEEG